MHYFGLQTRSLREGEEEKGEEEEEGKANPRYGFLHTRLWYDFCTRISWV